jgi:hypothetical protein
MSQSDSTDPEQSNSSDQEQSDSSDSNTDKLSPEYARILNVGSYFIDLAQYHTIQPSSGWVFSSDSTEPSTVCIDDESIFTSFTMQNAAEFEQRPYQDFVLLLKFPGKSQFLLYDKKKWELFTVRVGKLPHHSQQNTLQQLVDKCLRIVQYCIKKQTCQLVNNFVLLDKTVSVMKSENLTCKDFLSRSVYDGGKTANSKAIVELKSTWIVDEKVNSKVEPKMLYKSLFEYSGYQLNTDSSHYLDFKTVKSCDDITEGLSFVCPSEVPVNLAFKVLTKMHDRTWSLLQPTREESEGVLDTLFCDIDSGIFYLKAKLQTSSCDSLSEIISQVKSVLTSEILKCQVPYVPSGYFHGVTQDKPTIEPVDGGVFVKLPDPEHMNEVAKSWLWIKTMPTDFLACVQAVLCDVAKEILRLSPLGSTQISTDIIELKHSRVATHVPGGLLMIFSAFLLLSQKYSGLKLVLETYNNKNKGLIAKVDVTTPMDFRNTSVEMQRLILQNNSIFRVISDFCGSCAAELDESASSISFGFRIIHKDRTDSKNLHTSIKMPDKLLRSAQCQIFPMAFMHPVICPFLYHPKEDGEIIRVQMYLEPWSAHKNIHSRQSRKVIGQDIAKALDGNLLNSSALRSGLSDLVESWDASFKNWHDTSATRFEVACRPTLCRVTQTSTMFDLQAGLNTVWRYLGASFSFSPIDAVTTYSSVCTAAILIGYRASLDALKDSPNLEANQQCQIVDYMRYLNTIIHTLPSGRFVSNNPKLFLANLGLDSGRCLALVPTLPLRVRQHIVSHLSGLHFSCEDPQLPEVHSRNTIIERIEMLKESDSLEASMVLCSCGMGFFGFDRLSKLHLHLSHYPGHNSQTYKGKRITGEQWFATYVNQKQHLERWLSNHGTIEQQSLFQNVLNCKHTCSVGKAGTGKTFMMKKVDDFLSMIFLNPGEIVRIAPLGRVAQSFHCEARTVHSSLRLHMDIRNWTDNDVVSYLEQIKSDIFSRMKVLIGLEMFVMCDCVLSGLLTYIRKHHPKTLLLCEGDPIQLSVGKGNPVLCDPTFDQLFDTVVFDTQQRITNSEQQTVLDMMRLGKADERALSYWSSRVVEQIDGSCFTIYALKDNAEKHNEQMLKQHETTWKTARIQKIASDQFKGREVTFPDHVRRNCIVDKVLSIVPRAPVFFTRNINVIALCNSKEIYVGNGTPATVTRVEPSFIIVQLECGDEVKVEPISIDIEGFEGYTRTQYPLILGWASTIHKVQGMQFAKVQIHFCLKGNNIKKEAASIIYRGMAYMAFSRSENIKIIGQICLELLNNVNPFALQFWLHKVEQWSKRNSKDKKLVYRDAIHAHNDFCAQSFKEIRQLKEKNKRSISTTPLALNASVAAPASTSAQAAEVAASAPTKKSKEHCSVNLSTAPASAFAPDTAVLDVVNTSVQPAATDFISDRAVSFPVHARTSASASSCASASDQAYSHFEECVNVDIDIDDANSDPAMVSAQTTTVDAEPAPAPALAPDSAPALAPAPSLAIAASASKPALADAHAPAQHNVVIPPSYNDSVLKKWNLQQNDSRLERVSKIWKNTHAEVHPKLGQKTWEEGMSFREGSRGYGEAHVNVCLLMLEVLQELSPLQSPRPLSQTFVDIGSGLANIVLQMSALQPEFKCCFGIELETNRAAFAMEACRVFTKQAATKRIPFCQIQAREGNCFEDACCKQALMSADLVWVNNEVFSDHDNLRLFQFLNSVVPVHCIIMSFKELLVTKRSSKTTPQSKEPTDFRVHPPREIQNACSWSDPNEFKKVFIIQRETWKFAQNPKPQPLSNVFQEPIANCGEKRRRASSQEDDKKATSRQTHLRVSELSDFVFTPLSDAIEEWNDTASSKARSDLRFNILATVGKWSNPKKSKGVNSSYIFAQETNMWFEGSDKHVAATLTSNELDRSISASFFFDPEKCPKTLAAGDKVRLIGTRLQMWNGDLQLTGKNIRFGHSCVSVSLSNAIEAWQHVRRVQPLLFLRKRIHNAQKHFPRLTMIVIVKMWGNATSTTGAQ